MTIHFRSVPLAVCALGAWSGNVVTTFAAGYLSVGPLSAPCASTHVLHHRALARRCRDVHDQSPEPPDLLCDLLHSASTCRCIAVAVGEGVPRGPPGTAPSPISPDLVRARQTSLDLARPRQISPDLATPAHQPSRSPAPPPLAAPSVAGLLTWAEYTGLRLPSAYTGSGRACALDALRVHRLEVALNVRDLGGLALLGACEEGDAP